MQMSVRCRDIAIGVLLVCCVRVGSTQSNSFEIDAVSVREAVVNTFDVRLDWTPGRLTVRDTPFVVLLHNAYSDGTRLRFSQSHPFLSTRWDISATFSPQSVPDPEQRASMLRTILEDRFRLVVGREVRETEVYALELADTSGRELGPMLLRSLLPCDSPDRFLVRTVLPERGQRPSCGIVSNLRGGIIVGGDIVLERLAGALEFPTQRPVIDRTGLSGKFDVVLTFQAEDSGGLLVVRPGPEQASQGDAPSLFTALREQLGLRLRSTRAPVDYFVVEHVEPATPN